MIMIATKDSVQGGRGHMEDQCSISNSITGGDSDYSYYGIFDGHGGGQASLYAKEHLMNNIVTLKNFWSDDDQLVLQAIKVGFVNTHLAMWKELDGWPRTSYGTPSPCGTTASVAFIRKGKIYIGHVGDSSIVMGVGDPESDYWLAKLLTKPHKPENLDEIDRINQNGGKVMRSIRTSTKRVVWNRPRIGHKGPIRRSTHIDEVPFLAIARSLGDFWSYNSYADEFVVSPEPDVMVVDMDVTNFKCLVLASDGLWDVMQGQDAINSVYFAEESNEIEPEGSTAFVNPSTRLVNRALDRWALVQARKADNITVITVVATNPNPDIIEVNKLDGLCVTHSKSLLFQEKNENSSVGINESKKSPHSATKAGQSNRKSNAKKKIKKTVNIEKNNVTKNLRKSKILSNTLNSNSVGNRTRLSSACGSRENNIESSKRFATQGNNRTISTAALKPNKPTIHSQKRKLKNNSNPTVQHLSTPKACKLETSEVTFAVQPPNVKKSVSPSVKRSSSKVKKGTLKLEAKNREKYNQNNATKRNLRSTKSC